MYSITIIADASFCSETKAAGYGVWLAGSHGREAFEGVLNDPRDNNVAETMAIVNALWHGFNSGLIKAHTDILIQSDSETAIKVLTGIKQATNPQYVEAIEYIRKLTERYSLIVRYKHVPGHTKGVDSRTRAQNHCDTAARRQMIKQRDKIRGVTELETRNVTKPINGTNYLRSRRRKSNG